MCRLIATGDIIEYDAILNLETDSDQRPGRAVLERVRQAYTIRASEARSLFLAAEDLPIRGWPEWFVISDLPVEISRHTGGQTCMTRVVMNSLGYEPSLMPGV